jgi:hypothetical protein
MLTLCPEYSRTGRSKDSAMCNNDKRASLGSSKLLIVIVLISAAVAALMPAKPAKHDLTSMHKVLASYDIAAARGIAF